MRKLSILFLTATLLMQVTPVFGLSDESITNFRGGADKQLGASVGNAGTVKGTLKEVASFKTGYSKNTVAGGSGQGWTGQSLLLSWEKGETEGWVAVNKEFRGKEFTEVVSASLDGKVYFHDLSTFKETRKPLNTGNPLKGTPSTDGKTLFVGEGLAESSKQGLGLYDLRTMKKIYRLAEGDWSANDSSALFYNGNLFVASENGTFYKLIPKIEGDFTAGVANVTKKSILGGSESSITAFEESVFVATNKGKFYSFDSKTMSLNYSVTLGDDTDATMVIDVEDGTPVGYIGTEVDKYLTSARFIKLDLTTGKELWRNEYKCFRVKNSDGGFLASPLLDKEKGIIYISPSKVGSATAGKLYGLNTKTGKQVYSANLSQYSWSSPIMLSTATGKVLLHFDRAGKATVYSRDLKIISSISTGLGKIESSPVAKDNAIVCGGRSGYVKKFVIQ